MSDKADEVYEGIRCAVCEERFTNRDVVAVLWDTGERRHYECPTTPEVSSGEAERVLRGLAVPGDTVPFRPWHAQALRALLNEYDRRLHEGSTVTVHVEGCRLPGTVKSLGNARGPLVVVVDQNCQYCGCPTSILSACDCNCD